MVKILLIPLAIVAFVVFLIVLGAIGLGVAFAVIAIVNRLWRALRWVGRLGRPRRRSTSVDV
ncbi:MAG TPA: hypothetical protein VF731_03170 [Solirubrobacterales bacterium]